MSDRLSRRQFLKSALAVAGGALTMGTTRTLLEASQPATSPRTTLQVAEGEETLVPTACLLCPSACGMIARVVDGRLVKLEGNPIHPINLGSLCPKGQAALELLYNPDRVQTPLRRVGERGSGQWEPIAWDEALQMIAARLRTLRNEGHPERLAFLYGEARGQLRPLIERFTAAVGSPNAISHDSLNIEATRLAFWLTQGIYDLPAYDLENSRYILAFGANLLEAGRNPQRMITGYSYGRQGTPNRSKVVYIDPRQGITGAKADEWIPINPGTDGALALGMAHVIIRSGLFDADFVRHYAFGFDDFQDENGKTLRGFKSLVLKEYDPERVEKITGVPAGTIARLAGEFATTKPAVAILPGKGGLLNGSVNGLYTAMAILALNALVGAIEARGGILVQRYPECVPFPPLPADPIAAKGRQAERLDGAGTVYPLARHAYQAVADRLLGGYPLDTLLLYDANPLYECPGDPSRWRAALDKVGLIVSLSSFIDETAAYADLILPEPTFLERYQDDFIEGIGYPGVALRQPVVEPLYDTRPAGDVLIQLARQIGGAVASAFPWSSFVELLQARLANIGTTWEGLKELGAWHVPPYEFAPRGATVWRNEIIGRDRVYAPKDGRFDFYSRELACQLKQASEEQLKNWGITATGSTVFLPHYEEVKYHGSTDDYPFVLNVVTLMSLGPYSAAANLPTLQEICGMTVGESWEAWLEMNPAVAQELGLRDHDRVIVESEFGTLQTHVRLVPGLRRDVVNLPYNQGHRAVGRYAKGRGVNGLELLAPDSAPLTGLAAFTNTRVWVYKG